MSSRLGIYDIFSRIVPGGFYLGAFVEFGRVLNLINFNWATLKDLGVVPSLGLALIAFVIGTVMDRMGFAWQRLFRLNKSVLDEFKNEHKDWQIQFQDKDWAILRAYVYIHNLNVGDEIDRHNALSIMLRNISLGLALLAVCQAIQLIKTDDWIFGILVALLMFFSYQTGIQARYMRDWFYRSIFETIIAYQLKLDDRVKPLETRKKARTTQ